MSRRVTISTFNAMKAEREKFVMMTAYDATFSRLISDAGAETILVGDSLGMVLQGHDTTIPVSIDMAYHTRCVCRGRPNSLVVADMPFMSYDTTDKALESGMQFAGRRPDGQTEGGVWLRKVSTAWWNGVFPCARWALRPSQSMSSAAIGSRVEPQGSQIHPGRCGGNSGCRGQPAGAGMYTRSSRGDISSKLDIPTIGIGAGAGTDAQVLVLHDMLGLSVKPPKFVENFMEGATSVQAALSAFVEAGNRRISQGRTYLLLTG